MSFKKIFNSLLIFVVFVFFYSCSERRGQSIKAEYSENKKRISASFDEKNRLVKDSISEEEIRNKLDLRKQALNSKIKIYSKKDNNEKTDSLL